MRSDPLVLLLALVVGDRVRAGTPGPALSADPSRPDLMARPGGVRLRWTRIGISAARSAAWPTLLGLAAGLAFWTNQLAVIYLAPVAAYLMLRLGRAVIGAGIVASVGFLLGAAPFIVDSVRGHLTTAAALADQATTWAEIPSSLLSLWRVGLPVLVGLAQPIGNTDLWQAHGTIGPAQHLPVAVVADVLLVIGLIPYRQPLFRLLRRGNRSETGPALLITVGLAAVAFLPFTQLSLWPAEPRYALLLYVLVPLDAGVAWRLRPRRSLFLMTVMLPLALNVHNLATADPWLLSPAPGGGSTPETRSALIRFLDDQGIDRVYADYWLAYPLTFESRERIIASTPDGCGRYRPYAQLVSGSPQPAFVLISGNREADMFHGTMSSVAATGTITSVSIYDVVSDAEPIESVLCVLRLSDHVCPLLMSGDPPCP
ncbi:MAG: hypothetical protein GEU73_02150 [Chloroflexi bacterium]|nr:hypothetical protein [Chloroflexota bacterium]